jgi:general secretion pathway protein F
MSTWQYVAVDIGGRRTRGMVEADHLRGARAQLREMGLLPEAVSQRDARAANTGIFGGRITAAELALFSRQFAILLLAGLTIEKAIAALAEQPEREAEHTVLKNLREDVLAGHNLAAAMERQPRAFPRFFAAIVRAGEEAGALPVVMERLADYLERGQTLRHKLGMALVYPAIVTLVAMLVVGVLLTYVVPQVVGVFEHSRQSLPWLTRALIAVSDVFRATWWAGLMIVGVSAIAAWRALRLESVHYRWHAFLLGLPFIGRLRRGMSSARFANTLAVLVGSGVPAVTALGHAAASLDDLVFRQAVNAATARVHEGLGISRALREAGAFPPLLLHLVASGEASGELPRVLEQAARQQEQVVEARLAGFVALLEPLLILGMGGVVLTIVLATLEPLIEMNRLLR